MLASACARAGAFGARRSAGRPAYMNINWKPASSLGSCAAHGGNDLRNRARRTMRAAAARQRKMRARRRRRRRTTRRVAERAGYAQQQEPALARAAWQRHDARRRAAARPPPLRYTRAARTFQPLRRAAFYRLTPLPHPVLRGPSPPGHAAPALLLQLPPTPLSRTTPSRASLESRDCSWSRSE